MRKTTNQCIIFVTSKKQCEYLYKILKHIFSCTYAHSEAKDTADNIQDFRDKKYKYIVSTTVLERGLTIKDIDVIILNLNKGIFNEENLIQMLGRVGRSFTNPYGNAYILSSFISKSAKKATEEIIKANKIYEMSILRQRD